MKKVYIARVNAFAVPQPFNNVVNVINLARHVVIVIFVRFVKDIDLSYWKHGYSIYF